MAVIKMHATTDAVKTGTSTIGITFDGGVVVQRHISEKVVLHQQMT